MTNEEYEEAVKVGMAFAAQRFLINVRHLCDFDDLVIKSVESMFKDFKEINDYKIMK